MTTCKNCGLEFKSKFCPDCGQKAKTGRITLRHVGQELRQHLVHFDQGFLYTIKELALRPGHSIRVYLVGKRVKHIKPLKFLFWTAAISFLVFHYAGMDQVMMQQLAKQQSGLPESQLLSQKLMLLLTNHPAVMVFSMIPFIALCSWLLFRRMGYNYAEHFVLCTYLIGQLSLVSIITTPMLRFSSDLQKTALAMAAPSLVIWVVYFGWAYGQFFQTTKITVRAKGVLAIALGYLMVILFMGALVGMVMFFFRPQLEAWLQI